MHAQLCLTLCDPLDCSPPGSSVRGILQARILVWGVISFSGDLPNPGIELASPVSLVSPALAGGFFTTGATWEAPFVFLLLAYFAQHNVLQVHPHCHMYRISFSVFEAAVLVAKTSLLILVLSESSLVFP